MTGPCFCSCYAAEHEQDNPPKERTITRYGRVNHPNHPLSEQIVRVVRRIKHPQHQEWRWVIELADQTRLSLPISWVTPLTGPPDPSSTREKTSADDELWADAEGLLNLTRMVRKVRMNQLEKEGGHEVSTYSTFTADGAGGEAKLGERDIAAMGTTAASLPAGTGAGSEQPARQATARKGPPARGTSR